MLNTKTILLNTVIALNLLASNAFADTSAWTAPADAVQHKNTIAATPESIARGQHDFQQYCVPCHGKTGTGDGSMSSSLNPKPANLKLVIKQRSDGELAWKIAEGRGPMPGWKGILNPNAIWDVINYLHTL